MPLIGKNQYICGMDKKLLTYLAACYQNFPNQFDFLQLENLPDLDTTGPNFDYFNFYLLTQALLKDTENNRFQIHIPDHYYQDEKLSSTLLGLAFVRYYENQKAQEAGGDHDDFEPNEDVIHNTHWGPLLLTHKNESQYIFTKLNDQGGRKSLGGGEIFIAKNKINRYPRLPSIKHYKYTSQSVNKIKKYTKFIQKHVKDFSSLFRFNSKCLVIGERSLTSKLTKYDMMPFRVNLQNALKIPVEPLFEIANDYYQAKEILKKVKNIDTIIVIGAPKYRKHIEKLTTLQEEQAFKKLIIVGSEKAATDYGFKTWTWSHSELRTLQMQNPLEALPVQKIDDEHLTRLKSTFDSFRERWSQNDQVEELDLKWFFDSIVHFCARQVLPIDIEQFSRYIDNKLNRRNDFKSIFVEAGLQGLIGDYQFEAESTFETFINRFENPKLAYILALDDPSKDYYIVTEKKQVSKLKELFEEAGKTQHEAITPNKLERMLQKGKATEADARTKVFVFPYLYFKYENPTWYYRMYRQALDIGEAVLLQYENVEEQKLEVLTAFYEHEELFKLQNNDRSWYIDATFEKEETTDIETATQDIVKQLEETKSISATKTEEDITDIKYYFANYFGLFDDFEKASSEEALTGIDATAQKDQKKHTYTTSQLQFQVVFEDGSEKVIEENHLVAKQVDKGKFDNVMISNVQIGDDIIADFKVNFATHFAAMKTINALKPINTEIRWASREWRSWLKTSLRFYTYKLKSEDIATRELYKKLDLVIPISKFKTWLTAKDPFLFPKHEKDLEKVLDLAIRQTPPGPKQDDKMEVAERIRHARDIPADFDETVDKLALELVDFLLTKNMGKMLLKMKSTDVTQMSKRYVVKKVMEIEEL